jgi:uncharacterized membrane protein YfcA
LIDPSLQLPLYVVIAFVGFLISTLFGVGGALVLTPALMVVMPAAEAVSLTAPVLLFNNLFKSTAFRGHVSWRAAGVTLLTAAPFAAVGAALVDAVDGDAIKLGVVAIIFLALGSEHLLRRQWRFSLSGLAGAGVVIGFISGICSAAGPPTAVAYKGHGLLKERFVGTIAVLAVGMQLTKIPTYVAGGTLRAEHATLAAALVGSAFAAVVVGRRLHRHIDAARFRLALDLFLVVIAISLVVNVVR